MSKYSIGPKSVTVMLYADEYMTFPDEETGEEKVLYSGNPDLEDNQVGDNISNALWNNYACRDGDELVMVGENGDEVRIHKNNFTLSYDVHGDLPEPSFEELPEYNR